MEPRKLFPKRTLVYGGGAAVAVVLVVGILVFVALFSQRYHWRWDLTRDRSQSLTAISQALLKEVTKPLSMTAFYPGGEGDRQKAKELLQTYAYLNPRVTFGFVDPDREPLKAREAGYRFPGNILLEYEGRRQMAERPDEEAVSEALRKIMRDERKKLFFLTGHGERSIDNPRQSGFQQAKNSLANEGYDVSELNLLTTPEIPADAAAIILAGPQKPLFPQEVAALKQYLARGGRLLVMLEPFQDGGLQEFLAAYGIGLNDGIILDQNQLSQTLGASAAMPLVVQYGAHRITRDFTNVVTIFPMARPLLLNPEVKGAMTIPLATTTATSWEKMGQDWIKTGKAEFDAKQDKKGPFTLAALVEVGLAPPGKEEKPEAKEEKRDAGHPSDKPEERKTTYLVAFGDVDFAANGYFNLSGNGDLFLNTINFLAEEEKQIVIRKADQKAQPLALTGMQAWVLFLGSLIFIPLMMLGAGLRAYLRRRARR